MQLLLELDGESGANGDGLKNEEYEDGYQSECSSSLAFHPENDHNPHRASPDGTGSQGQREASGFLDLLLGPRLFIVLLIALVSLGLGHLLG